MAARKLGEAFVQVSGRVDQGKFTRDVGSQFTVAGDRAGRSFGEVFVKGFAALVAGSKLVEFFKKSVDAASDLNETTSKIGVVFGEASREVLAFGRTAKTAIGQSKQSALDAAATFGVFGKSAGLAGKDLAEFSIGMVKLTSDMASFSNTTPEEAIEAVGAALRGEAEPIRRYGVLLDDATLRQAALGLGLIKTTKEALTPANKVLAAQAEILRQTSDAQGDFARTSGGLANQQRIATAMFADFQVQVGEKLLPTLNKLLSIVINNGAAIIDFLGTALQVAAVAGTIVVALKAWALWQHLVDVALGYSTLRVNKAALALGGYLIAIEGVNALVGDKLVANVDLLGKEILDSGQAAKVAGEKARLFGGDMEKLDLALRNATSGGKGFATWVERVVPGAERADASWSKNIARIEAYDQALADLVTSGHAVEAGKEFELIWQHAETLGISLEDLRKAFPAYTAASDAWGRSMFKVSDAEAQAAKEGKRLIDVFDTLAGKTLDADEAMLAAYESINAISDAFSSGTKSVKGNTQASLENKVALERAAQTAQEAANAYLAAGGTQEGAAAIMQKFKNEAIKATGATGAQKREVQALADALFGIPPVRNTQINVTADLRVVLRTSIAQVQAKLNRLALAEGGIVKFFQAGGLESHLAQVVKAGTIRVFGEPETGGEAYIPLAPSKRRRSTAILAQVARQFGLTVSGGPSPVGSVASAQMASADLAMTNALLRRLIEAVERVAPGVGQQLNGSMSTAIQLGRAG